MIPRLKKSLGQHFLRDRGISGRIVDLLQIEKTDTVIEIGPGAGALSDIIYRRGPKNFVVLEKDAHWANERHNSGCQAILTDALLFDWQRLPKGCKIIGNLPYNVASPLIWDIVSLAPEPARAVFMVQKEVASRLAASPGSRAYGALSVWTQSHARVSPAFTVGPGAFLPPPKVDSAVFSLDFANITLSIAPRALAALLHLCFQNRRKQIGGIFRRAKLPESLLEGFDPALRPENLTVQDFNLIAQRGKKFLDTDRRGKLQSYSQQE